MTRPARLISGDILLAAALGVSLLLFPRVGHATKDLHPPAQARAMTAVELYALYGDKSWQWPDGAGLMDTKDRRFKAIAGSGKKASWAEGRWSVSDSGRLCFAADWHTKSGVSSDRTCFIHMFDEDTIYQRREPSGEWYVFKHAKPAAGDEFSKLVRDDLVSAELEIRKLNTRSKKKP
jgi:hypothetical protein